MKPRMGVALGVLALAVPSSAIAQWEVRSETDPMTDEMRVYAISPRTAPGERLRSPYQQTRAWIGYGCNTAGEWAFVGFTEAPNLTNTSNRDGYEELEARVRWDDQVESTSFTQAWGAAFLHFGSDTRAIAQMEAASTMLLELPWFGSGQAYFEFDLRGSTSAIDQARSQCGVAEPPDLTGTVPRSQARVAADPQIKIYFPIEAPCWESRIPDEDVVFYPSEAVAIAAGFREPRIGCETTRTTPPRPDSTSPAQSAPAADPAAPDSLSPTTTPVFEGVPEGMNFVAARVGALYYWVGCPNWRGLSPSDVRFFETREEAVEAGYRASSDPECRGPGG